MAKGNVQIHPQGHVRGPGTGTSDSILAFLSNGEYVLPAKTVKAVGKQNLDQLRAATAFAPRMALGGSVVDLANESKRNNALLSQAGMSVPMSGDAPGAGLVSGDRFKADGPVDSYGNETSLTDRFNKGAEALRSLREPKPAANPMNDANAFMQAFGKFMSSFGQQPTAPAAKPYDPSIKEYNAMPDYDPSTIPRMWSGGAVDELPPLELPTTPKQFRPAYTESPVNRPATLPNNSVSAPAPARPNLAVNAPADLALEPKNAVGGPSVQPSQSVRKPTKVVKPKVTLKQAQATKGATPGIGLAPPAPPVDTPSPSWSQVLTEKSIKNRAEAFNQGEAKRAASAAALEEEAAKRAAGLKAASNTPVKKVFRSLGRLTRAVSPYVGPTLTGLNVASRLILPTTAEERKQIFRDDVADHLATRGLSNDEIAMISRDAAGLGTTAGEDDLAAAKRGVAELRGDALGRRADHLQQQGYDPYDLMLFSKTKGIQAPTKEGKPEEKTEETPTAPTLTPEQQLQRRVQSTQEALRFADNPLMDGRNVAAQQQGERIMATQQALGGGANLSFVDNAAPGQQGEYTIATSGSQYVPPQPVKQLANQPMPSVMGSQVDPKTGKTVPVLSNDTIMAAPPQAQGGMTGGHYLTKYAVTNKDGKVSTMDIQSQAPRKGGGTMSVVSGPSVEDMNRQIAALRDLREARNPGITTGGNRGPSAFSQMDDAIRSYQAASADIAKRRAAAPRGRFGDRAKREALFKELDAESAALENAFNAQLGVAGKRLDAETSRQASEAMAQRDARDFDLRQRQFLQTQGQQDWGRQKDQFEMEEKVARFRADRQKEDRDWGQNLSRDESDNFNKFITSLPEEQRPNIAQMVGLGRSMLESSDFVKSHPQLAQRLMNGGMTAQDWHQLYALRQVEQERTPGTVMRFLGAGNPSREEIMQRAYGLR